MTPNRVTRLVVADDHPVVRVGLSHLLNEQPDFEVVADADCCETLWDTLDEVQTDIVLLDLEMGCCSGVEALEKLHARHPALKVIVFTAHSNEQYILDALRIGAQGYVAKGVSNDRLCEAIRVVSHEGLYLDPSVAAKLHGGLDGRAGNAGTELDRLTEREATVLRCVASGKRNKEIARELFISERTVKFHISSVLAKLGAKNRTEAVSIAANQRLINL